MARGWAALTVGVLVVGVILRLVHLGADPWYPQWPWHISDEGRWTEHARHLVLFGSLDPGNELANLHLVIAPLYHAVTVVVFQLFGVAVWSARLVSAMASVALLVVATLFLRRRLSGAALLAVMLVLAFQANLLLLSRVAIPEMASMLFCLIAFAVLMSAGSRRLVFLAGLMATAAVGFKATSAPIVPIFALIALLSGAREQRVRPGTRLTVYLAGAAAPVLVLLIVGVASGQLRLPSIVSRAWPIVLDFLRPESPYDAVAGLLYGWVPSVLGPLLLSSWLLAGLVAVVGPLPAHRAWPVWIGSALWTGGWLLAYMGLDYFPPRYVFHVVVPLALNIGAGLTLVQAMGLERIEEVATSLRPWRRLLVAAWLVLPLALLLAPVVIAAAGAWGLVLDRVVHHLMVTAGVQAIGALALVRWWRPALTLRGLIAVPLILMALRSVLVAGGLLGPSFWLPASATDRVVWAALVAAAFALFLLLRMARVTTLRPAATVFAVALTVSWLADRLPPIVAPTYSILDAGREIEEMVQEGEWVGTVNAAGILIGTDVRYTEHIVEDSRPDIFVVALEPTHPAPATEYEIERTIRLELGELTFSDDTLRIYRRSTSGVERIR